MHVMNRPHQFRNNYNLCISDGEVKCKESWVRNGDRCYFIGMNYTTWELARTTCQYKGGDLARITSDVETKFLSGNG